MLVLHLIFDLSLVQSFLAVFSSLSYGVGVLILCDCIWGVYSLFGLGFCFTRMSSLRVYYLKSQTLNF